MTKTYFITGAASGIGRQLAVQLLKRGERVLATDVNSDGLEELRHLSGAGESLWTQRQDVRDASQWQSLLTELAARWGRLDVLMNVAGVIRPGWVQEGSPQDVDFHLDINVKGVMHGTHAAARVMLGQGGGHIINIASLAGIAPVPGLSLYSASKFAVRGFTLAIAQELASKGIKVTAVCPDAVQTPMLDLQVDYEQAAMTFSGSRVLTVEDVAGVILDKVLDKAPLEVMIPGSRGWLAKLASAFPNLNGWLLESLQKKGRQQQQTRKPR
jgi:NAD(P)-dependent dehydrogenase (short-subunit alcohol dehydrogenase family)